MVVWDCFLHHHVDPVDLDSGTHQLKIPSPIVLAPSLIISPLKLAKKSKVPLTLVVGSTGTNGIADDGVALFPPYDTFPTASLPLDLTRYA